MAIVCDCAKNGGGTKTKKGKEKKIYITYYV